MGAGPYCRPRAQGARRRGAADAPSALGLGTTYLAVPMRQPPPNRINLGVLLTVVALHAAVFAYALQAPAPQSAVAPQRSEPAATNPPAAPHRPPQSPATAQDKDSQAVAEPVLDDPSREFTPRRWHDNQVAAAQAQDRRRFGASPELAPAAVPAAIERRLRAGDAAAAAAAAELQEDCSELGNMAGLAPTLDATLLSGLGTDTQALVRTAFEARVRRLAQRQQRCAAWHAERERMAQARRDYAARSDADTFEKLRTSLQLEPPTPGLLERLRAELQSLWESQSQSRVGRALVLQMLAHDNEAQDRVGLRLLLELAERDDAQVEFAANVLSRGFGQLPPQPELALHWQRRAAELGADAAIDAQLTDTTAAPAQIWAWHAWRIWLNAHGCYVDSVRAEDALLAADLRALEQLGTRLSAPERLEAGRLYLQRRQTFGDRARAIRHCDTQALMQH
ncbi:MAG: hypothetical protein JNN30_06410 [Rhodanobacteraceae bacterium]|nr:hypothetical protein [Rhodanobacteraceae bacterium]